MFCPTNMALGVFLCSPSDMVQDLLTTSHGLRTVTITFFQVSSFPKPAIKAKLPHFSKRPFHFNLTTVNIYLVGCQVLPCHVSYRLYLYSFLLVIFICEYVRETTVSNLSLYPLQWLAHARACIHTYICT